MGAVGGTGLKCILGTGQAGARGPSSVSGRPLHAVMSLNGRVE